MCGRYFLDASIADIEHFIGPLVSNIRLKARYNIAPQQPVPVVRQNNQGQRSLDLLRWGLVPAWSAGPQSRFSMINARAETVAEKPAYRNAFRYRRCVLPASGFYEWRAAGKAPKQPFVIRRRDQQPLLLAGLWEDWSDSHGNALSSCSIIVTNANSAIASIHQRMPVLLQQDDLARWLDPKIQHTADLMPLLKPCASDLLEIYPVNRAINNIHSEGVELIQVETEQQELF